MRQPEWRGPFNKIRYRFSWFVIDQAKWNVNKFPEKIQLIYQRCSGYIFFNKKYVWGRRRVQFFVMVWNILGKLTDDEENDEVIHILDMIYLFKRINVVLQQGDDTDIEFLSCFGPIIF